MKKLILLLIFGFQFVMATYQVGDQITYDDQMVEFEIVGNNTSVWDYDNFQLSQLNQAFNGGTPKVTCIIMVFGDSNGLQYYYDIAEDWIDNENVEIILSNSIYPPSSPFDTPWYIFDYPNAELFDWFNTSNEGPSTVFITHNMKIHYKANNVGGYLAEIKIQEMLDLLTDDTCLWFDDCGICCGGDTGVECNQSIDCNGDCYPDTPEGCNGNDCGNAVVDDCGICSGGNSDHEFNSDIDCNGVCFGDNQECIGCTYEVAFNYNSLSEFDDGSCEFESCSDVGDWNGDGSINVLDVVSIVQFILGGW
jgi:hypothetical protein